MATTVASHSVATFTSPVNGTTPIDANTVRGNDNTIRTAYNTHDADPGIHVQSSTLASRPAAGTAGRKWITEDSGVYTLWFDDGTNWHPVSSENVALTVLATQTLVKGDVVKVTGWNNGQDLPEVAKVSSASDVAFAIMTADCTINTMGYATNTGIVQDLNTNSFTAGTILYPSTSGGFTSTKPTSGSYQVVGYVLRQNTNNGVVFVEFSGPRIVERSDNTVSTVVLRDASGNFSAGTVTANLTGNVTGNVSGNAGTVTNGVYTVGDQTIADIKTFSSTIVGNISGSSGSTTGNAATATALQTARTINGVSFNGTADITVAAAAGTLTGNTLASNVVSSSLTSVGTLTGLAISGNAILQTINGSASALTEYRIGGVAQSRVGTQNFATGDLSLVTLTAAPIVFGTNNAERMRLDGSGNLAVDTNTLYVDAVNNRVGVGTASPAVTFQARVGTDARFSAFLNGSDNVFGYLNDSGNWADTFLNGSVLRFGIGGAERARLDASGNLGLGVTPSAWGGSGKGWMDAGTYGAVGASNSVGTALTWGAYHSGSGWLYKGAGSGGAGAYAVGADHRWYTAASGTAGAAISFTQAMTLDASGNLLVGTTSANYNSAGRGLVEVNGSSQSLIALKTGDTARMYAQSNGTENYLVSVSQTLNLEATGANVIKLATNGTERARITSGGDFIVGATGSDGYRLKTEGSYPFLSKSTGGAALTSMSVWNNDTAGDNLFIVFSTETGGVSRGSVSYNRGGGVVAYNTTSDYRAKDVFGAWQDAGQTIDALTVYRGKMKGATIERPMLIAHEAQAVAPYCVTGEKDAVDADGNPIYQQMDHSVLVPLLIAEVQSLRARVAALEA